jgi:hypothetical protein
LTCSAEEVVEDGRTDLRFRAELWDVIVELKIYASYGRQQLSRYLSALSDVEHAYVTAITRTVPTYGEPPTGADPRWLGSTERPLGPALRLRAGVVGDHARHMQVFLLKSADGGADRRAMSESNGHTDLIDDLTSVIRQKTWPERVPDLPRRAVEAALATTTDERAWALVRLAADLRALGDRDRALGVLDLAWGLEPSTRPAAAMFTCAIACHCDEGDLVTADVIASEQPDDYRDVKFARAACRLYATLLAETGEEEWKLELDRHLELLEPVDEHELLPTF